MKAPFDVKIINLKLIRKGNAPAGRDGEGLGCVMDHVKHRQLFLRISDAAVILLCVLSVAGYFFLPLWRVNVSVRLDERSEEAVFQAAEDAGMPEEYRDVLIEALAEMRGSGARLSASVSLKSIDYVGALFASGGEFAVSHLEKAVESGIESLLDSVRSAAGPLGGAWMKLYFMNMIRESMGKSDVDSSLEQVLDRTGLTDEWMKLQLEKIRTAVESDGATADSAAAAVMEVAGEAAEKMKSVPEYAAMAMQFEQQKEEARAAILETMKAAEDENGRISYDRLVDQILAPYIALAGQTVGQTLSGRPAEEPVLPDAAEEVDPADLARQTALAVVGSIPEGRAETLLLVMKIVGISLLLVFAVWTFVLVFAVCKLFSASRPGVPVLWVPVVFGWPHFAGLVLLPSVLFAGRAALARTVLESVGTDAFEAADGISGILQVTDVSFSSGSVFTAVSALVLLILLFFCAHHSRALKRELAAAQGN